MHFKRERGEERERCMGAETGHVVCYFIKSQRESSKAFHELVKRRQTGK